MANNFIVRWKRPRKVVPEQELNQYPETPVGYYAGYYPGSKLSEGYRVKFKVKVQSLPELNTYPAISVPYPSWLEAESNRIGFKLRRKDVPELNQYPATPSQVTLPAFLEQPSFRVNFRRNHLTPEELNNYPQTPAAYYDGYYPGSALATGLKVRFKQTNQILPELNTYAVAAVPATLPAFIEPPSFKWSFKRNHLNVLEINEYPETVPGSDLGLGVRSGINSAGDSINSLITSDGNGVLSSIDNSEGIFSKMSSQGKSVYSTVNSDGQGVESEL